MANKKETPEMKNGPLLIKKNRWTQRQLLQNILSRYFDIIDDSGGIWPSWIVKLNELEDPHVALENLNVHLDKLDWMAKLNLDEPYNVRIYPKPTGIFNLSDKYRTIMWMVATFSAWAMGTYWIYNFNSYDSYIEKELLINSFTMYALPLIAGLWIASQFQTKISKDLGMRVGGILPILLPLPLPAWPFGIAAIPSHPRMESIPWPDRKRLGLICIIAPLMMIIIGFVYLMIGLALTQNNAPPISSIPTKINLPFFAEILSLLFFEEGQIELLTNWVHPLCLAGMFLLTTGWICMLPFPTLPGGRALVAIMGSKSAKSSTTQIWLFCALFVIGMFYSIFEGSSFWTFVVIAGIMLVFFHGSDERIPMLLDDIKPLKDETKSKLGVILVLSLLVALPAEYPLEQVETWDSELITEWNDNYELDLESKFEISLSVYNPSLKNLEWSMNIWPEESQITNWNLSIECPSNQSNENKFECNSVSISPYSRETVYLNGFLPDIHNLSSATEIYVGFEQMGNFEISKIVLNPKAPILPTTPLWNWNGDYSSPLPTLCVNLSVEKGVGGTLSTDDLWSITKPPSGILDENIVSRSTQEVCLLGKDGIMQVYSMQEKSSIPLEFNSENLNTTWELLIPENLTKITSGKNTWYLHSNGTNSTHLEIIEIFSEEYNMQHSIAYNPVCNYEIWATYPELVNQTYILDFRERTSILIPSITNETIELNYPDKGTIMLCENNNPRPTMTWEIISGPNLILETDQEHIDWIGLPLAVIGNCAGCNNLSEGEVNITLSNYGNTSLEIKKELHGPDSVFETFEGSKIEIGPGNTTQISLKWNLEDGDAYLISWMEVDSAGELYLHLSMISQ